MDYGSITSNFDYARLTHDYHEYQNRINRLLDHYNSFESGVDYNDSPAELFGSRFDTRVSQAPPSPLLSRESHNYHLPNDERRNWPGLPWFNEANRRSGVQEEPGIDNLEDYGDIGLIHGSLSADDPGEETPGAYGWSVSPLASTERPPTLDDIVTPIHQRIHFGIPPSSFYGTSLGTSELIERFGLNELPFHTYEAVIDEELINEPWRSVCSICLVELHAGERISFTLCDHFFHTPCLDTWLGTRRSCPYCRSFV